MSFISIWMHSLPWTFKDLLDIIDTSNNNEKKIDDNEYIFLFHIQTLYLLDPFKDRNH